MNNWCEYYEFAKDARKKKAIGEIVMESVGVISNAMSWIAAAMMGFVLICAFNHYEPEFLMDIIAISAAFVIAGYSLYIIKAVLEG